ncbi:MAG: thioredoxin [Chloroflexi bacterium]|nr:thioredoxin [Chloroflexota bacterium]
MSEPVAVTDKTFVEEVLMAESPVLVDFWAAWCGPCRMVAPIVEQIAAEAQGRLKVAKVDVDQNPETAIKYMIQSIPTLMLFVDGKPVERLVGYMPKDSLWAKIEPHLPLE